VKDPVKSVFSPEIAHLPCFAYISYVVTGDFFFLEETYFWAGYVVLSTNPGYSQGRIGWGGQLRGHAWGLRTVAFAAGIACDNDPEKESFTKRVEFTLAKDIETLKSPDALPLGILAAGGNNEFKLVYAPWQHDYLITAVDCAAGAGFKDAETLRTLLMKFSIGRFTNAPDFDPQRGCGYWWGFEAKDGSWKVATWKDLYTHNSPELGGQYASILANRDNPGSYVDEILGVSAIGIRTGYPKAQEVHDFVKASATNILARRPTAPMWAFSATANK
jgi:hypothetical protein